MLQKMIIVLAVIGALVSILSLFNLSTSAISWWSVLFDKLAQKRKKTFLIKKAIKYKIEEIVNTTVFDLQKELPRNWVKKMNLKWVDKGSLKRLKNGQALIRIEPVERQDYNIINGVYTYFHHCLFPKTYEVVPQRVMNSLAVKLSQRTIENCDRKEFLLDKFNQTILEREIQNDGKILDYFEPFSELDNRGFLTGALIREIDSMAEKIRVKKIRNEFESIILDTIDHMMYFTGKLKGGKGTIPDSEWELANKVHKYRFLLAKRQSHMKVDAHLIRAKNAFESGVDRLYVFGSCNDIPYTSKLITRISNKSGFKHVETFDLDKDFHSNKKGIGALFIR